VTATDGLARCATDEPMQWHDPDVVATMGR